MNLYQEILSRVLENETMEVTFPNLQIDAVEIVRLKCYQALAEIQAILKDESLKDSEGCMKIEEILCIFEGLGMDCGNRHDFG